MKRYIYFGFLLLFFIKLDGMWAINPEGYYPLKKSDPVFEKYMEEFDLYSKKCTQAHKNAEQSLINIGHGDKVFLLGLFVNEELVTIPELHEIKKKYVEEVNFHKKRLDLAYEEWQREENKTKK